MTRHTIKRTDLLKSLKAIAKEKGTSMQLVREGAQHTLYRVGTVDVSVPRHREISEGTARRILKLAQEEG